MKKEDLIALLSTIVGVASLASNEAFGGYINTLFDGHGKVIIAALGAVGLVAGALLRAIYSPSGQGVIPNSPTAIASPD